MHRPSSTSAKGWNRDGYAQVVPESMPNNPFANLPYSCLEKYFSTFNAGEFEATSALFAEDGVLFPPFEDGILGPEAIATYLQAEASGMNLTPRLVTLLPLDGEAVFSGHKVEVKGSVKTPLFGVPVRWIFLVDEGDRIRSVGIQLLASLEELLRFKPQAAPASPGES